MVSKVLVIGLDAFDRDLATQWMSDGTLPVLAALRGRSLVGGIRNPRGFESGAAWPSFIYGSDPSMHGQHDGLRYFDPVAGTHRRRAPETLAGVPFWQALSNAGLPSVIIDVPEIPIRQDHRGIVVADWHIHDPVYGEATQHMRTHPPELAAAIVQTYGGDTLLGKMCDMHQPRSAEEIIWFRDALVERSRRKAWMAADFVQSEDWRLFVVGFADAHCCGHQCWHLHDTDYPGHDAAVAAGTGDPLKAVYQALDSAVGTILDQTDPDTTVMVYFSHGMQEGYSGVRLLDRILARLTGDMAPPPAAPLLTLLRRVWRAAPAGLRRALAGTRERIRQSVYNDGFLPFPSRRTCHEIFCNDRTGGVRINLAGRDPGGRVQPGAEYDALCNRLCAELMLIRNDETGEPLVEDVIRTRAAYDGPLTATLPDLLVTWNRRRPINVVSSPSFGRLRHPHPNHRSGDHSPHGMFMLSGQGFAAGTLVTDVDVIDLAPSLCALLGLDDITFQGRPLDAFRPYTGASLGGDSHAPSTQPTG